MSDSAKLYLLCIVITYVLLELIYIMVNNSKSKDKECYNFILKVLMGIGLIPYVNMFTMIFDIVIFMVAIVYTFAENRFNPFFNPLKKRSRNKNKLDK